MAKEQEIENRIKQDEQEKAIEKLTNGEKIDFNTLVRMFKREGIENFVVTKKEYIETVLNMLKEKDAEIEKLKQALARNIAKNFTSIMKESAKSKEDLEMLNAGWQIELEKKDKIIDLMATFIDAQNTRMLEDEYTAIKIFTR